MSAEVLRRAAALMREEAYQVRRPFGRDELVAVAVANLLDAHAEAEVPDDYDPSTDLGLHLALDIARAYLNESA